MVLIYLSAVYIQCFSSIMCLYLQEVEKGIGLIRTANDAAASTTYHGRGYIMNQATRAYEAGAESQHVGDVILEALGEVAVAPSSARSGVTEICADNLAGLGLSDCSMG